MAKAEMTPEEGFNREQQKEVYDWLHELGSGTQIRVTVERKTPTVWKGVNVKGVLGHFEEAVNEDDIRERWGGGKFLVKVQRASEKGGLRYAGSKIIDIAGAPKITGELVYDSEDDGNGAAAAVASESASISSQAMSAMQKLTERAQYEADKARETGSTFNKDILESLTKPLMDRVASMEESSRELQRELARKDDRIVELLTHKPEGPTFQDKILEKMVDGESARVDAIRTQHESELRQLRQSHEDDMKRSRDYHMEEARAKERAHEREIGTIRESNEARIDSLRTSYEARIDSLKSEIGRFERELTESRAELIEIRARKEKGPIENIQEILQLKEAFGALVPSGAEEENKSTVERIFETVLDSDVARNISARIANAPPAPGGMEPQQQQYTPEQIAMLQRRAMMERAALIKKKRAEKAAQDATPKGKAAKLNKGEVGIAVQFVEAAYSNGTDPATLASTARNLVPADILNYIKSEGVDTFLDNAGVPESSSLATPGGRNYLRKVAKLLLRGTTSEPPAGGGEGADNGAET